MTDDTLNKLAFLFLGWLLGLLAPIIVESIKYTREKALGRETIKNELAALREGGGSGPYWPLAEFGTPARIFTS